MATYTAPSISGYNTSPPPDDGSNTSSNEITWAGIKSKLADPIKTLADDMNTAISAMADTTLLRATSTATSSFSVAGSDLGKLFITTNAVTASLLAAATAGDGYVVGFYNNDASADLTIDPNASETIDGNATATVQAGSAILIISDGTSWYTVTVTPTLTSLAQDTVVGRATASTGSPEALGLGYGLEMDATNKKLVFSGAIQGGFKNLKISTSDGGTAPVVTADQVTVENSSGYSQRLSSLSVTMDLTGTGAGKLDTGTIATSTWYYIWAIAKDDGTKSTLASTSSTSPTLPSGYTYKARLGAVRTKSSSAVFVGSIQYGSRVGYTGNQVVMDSGNHGTPGTATSLYEVAVANFIPPTAGRIFGVVSVPSGGYLAVAAPNNTYNAYNATTKRPPAGSAYTGISGGAGSIPFDFMLEGTSIWWGSNNANGELICMGWEDNL